MIKTDFTVSSLSYCLPRERVAQFPLNSRRHSRLMVVDRTEGYQGHGTFGTLLEHLSSGDLCVFNTTRVIPARIMLKKENGTHVEFLFTDWVQGGLVAGLATGQKKLTVGMQLSVQNATFTVAAKTPTVMLQSPFSNKTTWIQWLSQSGAVPLPAYIKRAPRHFDSGRYQSLMAQKQDTLEDGSIAAPTASLHFDATIFSMLKQKNITIGRLCLHCGVGTFLPIRGNPRLHTMHHEEYSIDAPLLAQLATVKKRGKKVVAIGTTVTRALESYFLHDHATPGAYRTDLFIQPGFVFRAIDALVTNFHGARTTPLSLVVALSSPSIIERCYAIALAKKFRFLSYGDAMYLGHVT